MNQSPIKTKDSCYRCKQVGHWAKDCTQSPNKRSPNFRSPNFRSPMPIPSSDYPATHCPCGAGVCEIRVSHSEKNPNREFYKCPGKNEKHCEYFMWCDGLKREDILEVQPREYPTCGCGAGVCRLKTEESEPNNGRSYYACHIKEGYGACKFRQWVDIPLEENQLSPEDEMRIDAISDCAKEFSSEEDQVQMENGLDISSLVALENDDWPVQGTSPCTDRF